MRGERRDPIQRFGAWRPGLDGAEHAVGPEVVLDERLPCPDGAIGGGPVDVHRMEYALSPYGVCAQAQPGVFMIPSIFAVSGVKHVLASGEDRRAMGAELKRWATAVIGRWRHLRAAAPPPRTDSSSRPLQTLPNHYHVQRSAGKPGRHPDRRHLRALP